MLTKPVEKEILNEGRANIIKDVIATVDSLPAVLRSRKLGCSDVCREILLNNFVKKRSMWLWGPAFNGCEHPFHGVSFDKLAIGLFDCAELDSEYIDEANRIHLCDLVDFVEDAINVGEKRMKEVLDELSL